MGLSLAMIWRRRPGATISRLAAAALLAAGLALAPARGQAAEPAEPTVWAYSFYKTLTYELLATTADFILYTTLLGQTAATSVPFLAVNAVSAASAYYLHEVSWNIFGPLPETRSDYVEIGLAKALTYRVVSTAQHLAVAYAFTGNLWASAGYAAATNLSDTLVYLANEYGWDAFGPPLPGATAAPQEAGSAP